MKKFNEYSSFEEKVLSTLKKKPSDLLTLSHKLGEDVTPVNSMLQHLQIVQPVFHRTSTQKHHTYLPLKINYACRKFL